MPPRRRPLPTPPAASRARALWAYLRTETASGAVVIVAVVAAVAWANSPWPGGYTTLWATELGIAVGQWELTLDLRHWVNDGLMALFFLVVALEIKRELVEGELRDRRSAALPVAAAIGGMAVPALVYLAVAGGTEASGGWAIPMATDIAFALGALALAGSRVPASLKLFLLALAIVDDVGAIVVIALVYSRGVEAGWMLAAALIAVLVVLLHRANVRSASIHCVCGLGLWLATHEAGLHATLAGVTIGLLTPARPRVGTVTMPEAAKRRADRSTPTAAFESAPAAPAPVSRLERLERLLHPWTSLVVVPVFAFANAGIVVSGPALTDALGSSTGLAVVIGLVVGKPAGILGATWVACRTGLGRLPPGATWSQVAAVALLGGIGFTVSLFITELALPADLVDGAKIGVFTASVIAGAGGIVALRLSCRPDRRRPGTESRPGLRRRRAAGEGRPVPSPDDGPPASRAAARP
ncbi:MAG: Na+/H+ antiporter NhaA [Acidimicrobiia bacterium]